jgi:tryptophan-rich sensory protein
MKTQKLTRLGPSGYIGLFFCILISSSLVWTEGKFGGFAAIIIMTVFALLAYDDQ